VDVLDSVIPIGGKLGVWQLPDVFADAVRAEEARIGTRFAPGVELTGNALAETHRAVWWRFEDGRARWIPKSQILADTPASITVTRWFASKLLTHAPETP
jgi:hypothetical protein